jgi:membrane protein implicated in regulation of membrane protease activity
MNKGSHSKKILSIVLLVIIVLLYLSSIIFALLGNFELTLYIFGFNTVFVVIVFFLIRFNRFVTEDDNIELEDDKGNEETIGHQRETKN